MPAAPEMTIHPFPLKGLKLFDADRTRWLDEAAELGPLTVVRMGPLKLNVVTDPELARTILLTEHEKWMRPPATVVPIRLAVGENLFTQSDTAWTHLQPAVAPNFRRKALDARLADIAPLLDEEVEAIPFDTDVDFDLAMGRIALVLAAWVMFGERLESAIAEQITRHQREAVRWVGSRLGKATGFVPLALGAPGRAMKRHAAFLNAFADDVIARAQAGSHADDDVLSALLRARPGGNPLKPHELRSQVLGLFLAGNETTATALSWALVHGAAHPEEWARLRSDPDRWASPYIDETLRLTPAVWGIPRAPTVRGVHLSAGGATLRIRRGEIVTVYLRGMNRNADRWPEPHRFDPGRFRLDDKEQQRALLPFGLGPRGCIGQQLALAEMRAVLPALARRGDVTIDGPVVEDPNFALRVRGGLRGRFTAPANV